MLCGGREVVIRSRLIIGHAHGSVHRGFESRPPYQFEGIEDAEER